MLLHDAIARVCSWIFGDDDGAAHFDITHVVGGVVHRKCGARIAGNVAQLLFASCRRKQNVIAIEQKPQGSTLRTAVVAGGIQVDGSSADSAWRSIISIVNIAMKNLWSGYNVCWGDGYLLPS